MRGSLLLLVLGLVCAPGAAEPGRLYVTEMGRVVLGRCDAVVAGTVVRLNPPFRGITSARIRVTEMLAGQTRDGELVVLFVEDYLAPEALTSALETLRLRSNPEGIASAQGREVAGGAARVEERRVQSAPRNRSREGTGVRLAEEESGFFFLKQGGTAFTIVGYVPRGDILFESKLRRMREILAVEEVVALDLRVERARDLFLGTLGDPDLWLRGNSAREIRSLATRYPTLFSEPLLTRILAAHAEERDPHIRANLERAVSAASPRRGIALAEEAEVSAIARLAEAMAGEARLLAATRDADLRAAEVARVGRQYRLGATRLLAALLSDREPVVRTRAAQALATFGGPSARPALRAALEVETESDAVAAMVEACGALVDDASVPLLEKRLREPRHLATAVVALARIGSPAARDALRAHRGRADAETARMLDGILAEEFADGS
ncbi:MAG: HEAT repeat domain-containing protein [Planctomycetaceae bacterium]